MYGAMPVILAISAVAAALWGQDEPLNASERELFQRLESVAAEGPPSSSGIVRAFGLSPACGRSSCFFERTEIGGAIFAEGNLRPARGGLVFVLERAAGQCIRVDRVAGRFGTGMAREACAHGGCWYVETRRQWGILAFGLDDPEATCVASVVINSLAYQRPRNDAR